MQLFIKLALFVAAVLVAVIIFIHLLPVLLVIVALAAVLKLYHWMKQPRDNRPLPRWPWGDQ